jgi:hypothetical protein
VQAQTPSVFFDCSQEYVKKIGAANEMRELHSASEYGPKREKESEERERVRVRVRERERERERVRVRVRVRE